MFNFKRAALALVTLTSFTGLLAGTGLIIASIFVPSLTLFVAGTATLIVALSVVAGLDT